MTTLTDKMPAPVKAFSMRAESTATPLTETVNAQMLALMRCFLAFLGLVILWAGPSQSNQSALLTYGPLALYSFYSVILVFKLRRFDLQTSPKITYWADVFFYAYAIAMTGGAYSFFFLFFFYPILVSSFSWGFREGMLVTSVSMLLFIGVELAFAPDGKAFDTGSTLIHAAYLFMFGYLISYLGGYERFLKRKLALLKEINNQWSPRFGVDHVNGVNLGRLLEFYNADSCVLVLRRPTYSAHYVMYSTTRGKPGRSMTPSNLDEGATAALLRLPDMLGAYYHDPEGPWWLRYRGYSAYDFDLGARTKSFETDCAAWANLLDTLAFVTVPYSQHDGTCGRIFLTSSNSGFTNADIEFLGQASDAMATIIENMCLVEELITGAAEHERLAISRDLHDTTIQPYIGLKLALDALYRQAGENNALTWRIAELIDMAETTVRDLRNYAATLKDKAPMPGEFLVAAVRKQTERLGRIYGINVELKSDISPQLKGEVAADAYQIISEGLSNVLRHTSAKSAFVNILCENSKLLLKVGNEAGAGTNAAQHFVPRSIYERAKWLGGETFVEQRPDHYTVVHVTIPM